VYNSAADLVSMNTFQEKDDIPGNEDSNQRVSCLQSAVEP